MTTKYEVTIKFLIEDDVPVDDLNQFLGELQAPADDPSVDVTVYSIDVKWTDSFGQSYWAGRGQVLASES